MSVTTLPIEVSPSSFMVVYIVTEGTLICEPGSWSGSMTVELLLDAILEVTIIEEDDVDVVMVVVRVGAMKLDLPGMRLRCTSFGSLGDSAPWDFLK